jgi:hypothetical protein
LFNVHDGLKRGSIRSVVTSFLEFAFRIPVE